MSSVRGGAGAAGAAINFAGLRERSRRELCECLDMMPGPKALVLDPSLSGPLGLVAEKQLLKVCALASHVCCCVQRMSWQLLVITPTK